MNISVTNDTTSLQKSSVYVRLFPNDTFITPYELFESTVWRGIVPSSTAHHQFHTFIKQTANIPIFYRDLFICIMKRTVNISFVKNYFSGVNGMCQSHVENDLFYDSSYTLSRISGGNLAWNNFVIRPKFFSRNIYFGLLLLCLL